MRIGLSATLRASAAAALVGGLGSTVWAQSSQPPAQAQAARAACERACLEGFVDRYLDAMLANEVSPSLFAVGTKFTENGIRLPLGNEGLWFGMSGRGTYKFYVPDIETQQVAFIGTAKENMQARGANTGEGNLVGLAVRLKIVNGLITEVEQLVQRPPVNLFGGGGGGGGGGSGGGGGGGAAPPRFPPVGQAVEAMGAVAAPDVKSVTPASSTTGLKRDRGNQLYFLVATGNGLDRDDTYVRLAGTNLRVYDIQVAVGWNDDGKDTVSDTTKADHIVTLKTGVFQ